VLKCAADEKGISEAFPAGESRRKEAPSRSDSKLTRSLLVGQAWEQLQGTVLEEIRKRVEELAEAERESLLGRSR